MTPLRLLPSALLLVLLAACSPPAEEEEPADTAEAADVEEVRAARDALGDPTVTLAESVISLGEELDAARHRLPRGQEMQLALVALDTPIEAVLDAADAAEEAAAPFAEAEDPAAAEAAGIVDGAVQEAREAVAAAEEERAALVPLAELDAGLDGAIEVWDEPGSQTERREALASLAAELDATAEQAEALEAVPEDCPEPWERRPEWARLLAERTRELEATATGAAGEEHDALRAEYGAEPYGEDRQAADAADRDCWEEASQVAHARAAAPGWVDELERALNPER